MRWVSGNSSWPLVMGCFVHRFVALAEVAAGEKDLDQDQETKGELLTLCFVPHLGIYIKSGETEKASLLPWQPLELQTYCLATVAHLALKSSRVMGSQQLLTLTLATARKQQPRDSELCWVSVLCEPRQGLGFTCGENSGCRGQTMQREAVEVKLQKIGPPVLLAT